MRQHGALNGVLWCVNPYCAELAAAAGIRHSSACGRVKALLDVGILEELPRRRCRVTGESAHPVRLAPMQRDLFGMAA